MVFHLHKLFKTNCGCAGFDPQGLSGTAWALAQLGLADAPFFCAMAEAVPRRFAELGALEESVCQKALDFHDTSDFPRDVHMAMGQYYSNRQLWWIIPNKR